MSTIPDCLDNLIQCISCRQTDFEHQTESHTIRCTNCGQAYDVINGIPSIIDEEKAKNQDWNSHDSEAFDKDADSYYKRAKGELPEKEASKSLARLLDRRDIYTSGDKLLDVGCASGHFLKSLRRLLDPEIRYTGVDIDMKYLQWGRDVYSISDTCTFVQADALDLPFSDDSFETVYANLFHFFPRINEALEECLRVSENRTIWRTPIGETTYMVKELFEDNFEDIGTIEPERTNLPYTLYMLYSKNYIEGLVESNGWEIEFIERDDDFEPFDNTENFADVPATKVVDRKQINGNLILDWHYVSISDD